MWAYVRDGGHGEGGDGCDAEGQGVAVIVDEHVPLGGREDGGGAQHGADAKFGEMAPEMFWAPR